LLTIAINIQTVDLAALPKWRKKRDQKIESPNFFVKINIKKSEKIMKVVATRMGQSSYFTALITPNSISAGTPSRPSWENL